MTQTNGEPVAGAHVEIAYEHTYLFENLAHVSGQWVTDPAGNAIVHVFGDSRIRIWAEWSQPSQDSLPKQSYSPVVQIEGSKLPTRLDLVLSSSERRLARF